MNENENENMGVLVYSGEKNGRSNEPKISKRGEGASAVSYLASRISLNRNHLIRNKHEVSLLCRVTLISYWFLEPVNRSPRHQHRAQAHNFCRRLKKKKKDPPFTSNVVNEFHSS